MCGKSGKKTDRKKEMKVTPEKSVNNHWQMPTLSPLVNVLLDCLRYDNQSIDKNRLSRLSETEWQSLATLALQQSVGPLLDHKLTTNGLGSIMPDVVKQKLRQQYRHNTFRNLKLQSELRQVVIALREADIPVITLKGIYLALAVYNNSGLREMNDIDLLIKSSDIDKAKQVLHEIGYNALGAEIPSTSFQHLPPLKKPNAIAHIELHWNIVPSTSPFNIDPDKLWERAQPFCVADFELLTLSPEDLLLHLFLHSAYMHRFVQGVRSLADIAEVVQSSHDQLDWIVLEHRHRQWQCSAATNISLLLTNQLLKIKFPGHITNTIQSLDIDSRLLAYTLNQLVGDETEKLTITRNFATLWGDNSLLTNVKILLRSIFRPPKNIAQMYGIPEDSLRVYFYYLVRAKDLWRRYGGSAKQMLEGESQFTAKIEMDNAFSDWLIKA